MKAKIYRVSDTASFLAMQERAVKAEARVKELEAEVGSLRRDDSLPMRAVIRERNEARERNQEARQLLTRAWMQLDEMRPVQKEIAGVIRDFLKEGEGTKQE
jgi:uncharacterized membrane protein